MELNREMAEMGLKHIHNLPLLSLTASSGQIAANQQSNNQHVKYHDNLKNVIHIMLYIVENCEIFSHPQVNPPLCLVVVFTD